MSVNQLSASCSRFVAAHRAENSKLLGRSSLFLLLVILSIAIFWLPLSTLAKAVIHDERYSHVLLIPIISVCLAFVQRKRIFLHARYSPIWGTLGLAVSLALYATRDEWPSLDQNDRLSVTVSALTLLWIAAFVLCYGIRASQAAIFPLLFLFLAVPIPTVLLGKIILVLQNGSATMTHGLFKLLHVPVLRQGVKFSLPGVDIEIANECSGIRSSLALFITGTVAAHLFLRSNWRKVVLAALTVPIAIFKNAVRIVTLSTLGVYVDPGFLTGRLHQQGGVLFSLLSLAMFVPLLFAFQRWENQVPGGEMSASYLDPATRGLAVLSSGGNKA
jgi:exosortase